MAFLTQKKFDFVSRGLASDTFGVVRFRGAEGFSRCYEFEIELVSTETEIDLDQVLSNPATFTILREDGDIPFHGILAEFEQRHQVDEYVFYRAVLVPKLWWLSLTHHNQVFLDKNVTEIVQEVLKDGGLTSLDFDLRLQGNYPQWEYICQYRESHLDFVSRWMEREGMYYYFEQGEGAEKAILTDSKMAHKEMEQGKTMYYSPPSGMDASRREEVIKSFVCRQKMLPKSLKLKDYNYRTPSLDLSGSAEVKSQGRGEVYIYGEHFRTPEEGNDLAKIRAEELLCQEKRFSGESTIPYLRPGFLFDLQDHYRSGFNQTYLTLELTHEGSQTGFLLAGIQKGLSELEEQPYYRNSFVAIPANVQFRPERKTEKARFYGTMNAKIDAAGSGKYAELDEHGRYKILLPFDLSGNKDGKGSAWLRMAQPYAGTDHGMHFPLHKGTEVLLTFIDGDPDRPIVQGAVPNPEMPSQVTSADQSMSKITTAGGNKIHMEDQEGSERILMHVPGKKTFVRFGAPNDPTDDKDFNEKFDKRYDEKKSDEKKDAVPGSPEAEWDGIAMETAGLLHVKASAKNELIGGEEVTVIVGTSNEAVFINKNELIAGLKTEAVFGVSLAYEMALKGTFGPAEWNIKGSHEAISAHESKVVGNRLDAAESDIRAHGQRIHLAEQDIGAHVATIEAAQSSIRAHGQKIQAAEQSIQAQGQKIQANATAIDAQGQKIKTIGNAMEACGNHMVTAGVSMKQSGTKLDNAGLKLEQGGMAMKSAGLLIHG
ncbi:MAG: type VI secretion system tip protein VgrG [Deltaproteobacteria bacterium HGW-Deltaproteobacteria-15]|nr:MAG: type VI secretion system tip protein VgrG [Deltaproteobacteria bacterium HGW-Deltaproteobacteria-15]